MHKTYNYIIVGQGIAGSVLALSLLKANQTVLIIDEPFLSSSSRIAAGLYNPIVFKRLVESWKAEEFIPALNNFYLESEQLLGVNFHTKTRIVKLFVNDDEKKLWQKQSAKQNLSQWLDENIYLEPSFAGIPTPDGFSFVKQAGFINTSLFLDSTANYFKSKDVYLQEKFDHNALTISNDHILYKNIVCKNIIFCEGYRAMDNPLFENLPFKLTKGEVLEITCNGLAIDDTINKGAFMVPLGNHRYKIGATYQWDNLNEEATGLGKRELTTKLEKVLPMAYTIVNHQAGIRPTVIDRRPIIGMHSKYKNVYIFNGMGTKAVMMAPFLAMHFTNHLLHKQPLIAEVDINRFNKK